MLVCLITASGFGSRFQSNTPKQYHKIQDEFILQKTINTFSTEVDKLIVIIRNEDEKFFNKHFAGVEYTFGGNTRQVSVLNGLLTAKQYNPNHVLIADGVRPFVSKDLIKQVINNLNKGEKAVVPCVKIYDTVKKVQDGYILGTLNRDELMVAQTPQGFDFNLILELHQKYHDYLVTDDSSLAEMDGIKVKFIEGRKSNIKITTMDDLNTYKI
jgi:2-C-methyl-D-erythritol 4-phosphate cytidylyltransferase/2-C-methyl-D-erythritol 2,4-cyclodiphosphate synthase